MEETPTATPVEETPTPTPEPEPTDTPVPVEEAELSVIGASVVEGEEVTISIEANNLEEVDAFGFDVTQSEEILNFLALDTTDTLVDDFFEVNASVLDSGAVRIAAIGGDGVAEGDGVLLKLTYSSTVVGTTTLEIANIEDDLIGAVLTSAEVEVTESETPTATPETPTATPEPEPTDTPVPEPTATPETPTEVPEPTATPETPTEVPEPTETPEVTPTREPTQVGVHTPTPTPTQLTVNPVLGLVALDHLGGTYPAGAAVHNFDIGISDQSGNMVNKGVFDGKPDPSAFGPFLFVDGVPVPIAKDIEFSGEIAPDGNGSEGVYFLIGGSIGPFPPVNPRLGATGGPNRGGIDYDNDGDLGLNYGNFQSDIIPVLFTGDNQYQSPLVDLEPAGNNGFYVLSNDGKIDAEGDALDELETTVELEDDAEAVAFKIFRGATIDESNSQYSSDLIGTGAYVLDSKGFIHTVGEVEELDTSSIPVVPQQTGVGAFQDMEYMPNEDGTEFIGLSVLRGDGIVYFVPFSGLEVTDDLLAHVRFITPFNKLEGGFPFDIARDLEVEVSANPAYGLDEEGNTVPVSEGNRVGMFLLDGFGGAHTGGEATRYAPAFLEDGRYQIPYGEDDTYSAFPYPISPPYFGADVTVDLELTWPVYR